VLGERAIARDPTRRTLGVATDGSASGVRALLDELDPERRAVERLLRARRDARRRLS